MRLFTCALPGHLSRIGEARGRFTPAKSVANSCQSCQLQASSPCPDSPNSLDFARFEQIR